MFISSFSSKLLNLSPVSFPSLLVPCVFFLYFTFDSLQFFLYFVTILNHFCEIPITSVLNCAFDRLAISSLLSCIFFWSFDLFFHVGHSLSQCPCYIVKCRASGIHEGEATHFTVLWHCMWGRGPRRNKATCSALSQLLVTSSTIHKQLSPSGADSLVGRFV